MEKPSVLTAAVTREITISRIDSPSDLLAQKHQRTHVAQRDHERLQDSLYEAHGARQRIAAKQVTERVTKGQAGDLQHNGANDDLVHVLTKAHRHTKHREQACRKGTDEGLDHAVDLDGLVLNALGLKLEFALSLIVVLVFSILTNTFCATNITRDGKSALKAKSFPIKASKLLFSKVLFCSIISSLSVIASVLLLYFSSSIFSDSTIAIQPVDAVIVCAIGLVFSFSQILIATRTDLNCAVVDASPEEVARASDRTIAKVVSVGLVLAVVIGLLTFFISVFSGVNPDFTGGIVIEEMYAYIFPAVIALLYFALANVYYYVGIEKAFAKLTK